MTDGRRDAASEVHQHQLLFFEHVFSCSELRPRTLLGGGKHPGPGSRAAGSLPDWLGFEELSIPFEMLWDVPSNTGTL